MRELVRKIDTRVELVNLEVTSNLNVAMHGAQIAEDVQAQLIPAAQPAEDIALFQSTDPTTQV